MVVQQMAVRVEKQLSSYALLLSSSAIPASPDASHIVSTRQGERTWLTGFQTGSGQIMFFAEGPRFATDIRFAHVSPQKLTIGIGNRGASAMTPLVLTPSGSCQVYISWMHLDQGTGHGVPLSMYCTYQGANWEIAPSRRQSPSRKLVGKTLVRSIRERESLTTGRIMIMIILIQHKHTHNDDNDDNRNNMIMIMIIHILIISAPGGDSDGGRSS